MFEPVNAEVKKGDDVIVSVRLKHKPTGKPVADAIIVQKRIDMAPDAMAEMASPLTAVSSTEPGHWLGVRRGAGLSLLAGQPRRTGYVRPARRA